MNHNISGFRSTVFSSKKDQILVFSKADLELERKRIKNGANDEDEMVTLEFIPKFGGQKLPEKPQVQSCITQFFKKK